MHKKFACFFLLAALIMAACAPEDLDITPSPTATNTPEPTNTPVPTATPNPNGGSEEEASSNPESSLLDAIVAAVPGQIPAGALTWIANVGDVQYRDQGTGRLATIPLSERQGSQAEIIFGEFTDEESAFAFYENVRTTVRNLENSETRDNFPQPNAFGAGTYGQESIWLRGNVYARVRLLIVSSTAGNALVPLSRAVNGILDSVLGAS